MHYKLSESMYDDNNNISTANENLKAAKDKADDLIEFLKSAEEWKGKGKESVIALLELCTQLHGKLLDVSEDNEEALKKIISNTDDFMSNDDIINIWRKQC